MSAAPELLATSRAGLAVTEAMPAAKINALRKLDLEGILGSCEVVVRAKRLCRRTGKRPL